MKHLIAVLIVATGAVIACLGLLALPVQADPPAPISTPPLPPAVEPLPTVDEPVQAPTDDRHEKLRTYTLDLMNGWTHAVPQLPTADYGDIASDIAFATLGDPRGAGLLAGLGYWEGARYAAYVDDLRCNDPEWRASPEGIRLMHIGGNCDNGHAYTIWQIHPLGDPSSPLYPLCNKERITGSRLDAAKCALALAKSSLAANGTLSGYTGEWGFEHPKADVRLEFVDHALAKHPFGQ